MYLSPFIHIVTDIDINKNLNVLITIFFNWICTIDLSYICTPAYPWPGNTDSYIILWTLTFHDSCMTDLRFVEYRSEITHLLFYSKLNLMLFSLTMKSNIFFYIFALDLYEYTIYMKSIVFVDCLVVFK